MKQGLVRIASAVSAFALLPSVALAQATPSASPVPAASPIVAASPIANGASITATYTLPDTPIGTYQDADLPNAKIANERGFLLGGIGSDLWHSPDMPADEFWMVTDRGPNGTVTVGDEDRTTFPVPDFDPIILHVKVTGSEIDVLDSLPIVGADGAPVTGVANQKSLDDVPYDATGQNPIPFNPSGLDTEGLVRTADGDFWLADEYSPSIIHLDKTGKVIARYTPKGNTDAGADYQVVDNLPAIYGDRRGNRGFEGLTLSGDGKTLYAALQSPLYVPDSKTGKASVNTRILAFDIATAAPSAEYVYQFDDINVFDPSQDGATDAMKLSSIAWVNDSTLLLDERTDPVAKLYKADLSSATNILGSQYDDPTFTPSLEASNDLSKTDVTPLQKTLLVDLSTLGKLPIKIEGVAIVDDHTIAISNDNDFDINDLDANGNLVPTGKKSQIFVITIPGGIGVQQ